MSEQTVTITTPTVPPEPKSHWHMSKEIPITLVVALVLQFGGLLWYTSYQVATVNSRITTLEKTSEDLRKYVDFRLDAGKLRVDQLTQDRDKLIRLEQKVENIMDIVKETRDSIRDAAKRP